MRTTAQEQVTRFLRRFVIAVGGFEFWLFITSCYRQNLVGIVLTALVCAECLYVVHCIDD